VGIFIYGEKKNSRMKAVRKGSDFLVQLLLRHKVKVLAFLAMLWLLVIFADMIVPALAITALGIIAMFSTSYKRVIRIPPAIEMVTFTTVIVSLAYGPFVGAIYAVVTTIAAEVMTNALDIFIQRQHAGCGCRFDNTLQSGGAAVLLVYCRC
jgi:hypothetical protein